ncbi:hypothetical protein ACP4OV_006474 [Aristida adscensionis]
MRIRRNAARLLRSASVFASGPAPTVALPSQLPLPIPPPPTPPPSSAVLGSLVGAGSATATAEICQLSRSPWDLLVELNLLDPQVEDDILDEYFVSVPSQPRWFSTPSMSGNSKRKGEPGSVRDSLRPKREVANKALKKIAAISQDMGEEESGAKEEPKTEVGKCKKTDGRKWRCKDKVSAPHNTLCDYHMSRKLLNKNRKMVSAASVLAIPVSTAGATPKPAASSKPLKKKPAHDQDFVGSDMASRDDDFKFTAIRGVDVVSSRDNMIDASNGDLNLNDNGVPRAYGSRDGKKTNVWKKRCTKPVNARPLRSLM